MWDPKGQKPFIACGPYVNPELSTELWSCPRGVVTLTTVESIVELLVQTQELWEGGLRPLAFYKQV